MTATAKPATGSSERESRSDNGWQADLGDRGNRQLYTSRNILSPIRVLRCGDDRRTGVLKPDPIHCLPEKCPVLGHLDCFALCADQFDFELVEDAKIGDGQSGVQAGLPAQREYVTPILY